MEVRALGKWAFASVNEDNFAPALSSFLCSLLRVQSVRMDPCVHSVRPLRALCAVACPAQVAAVHI